MKQSLQKNRARQLQAALETLRHSATALIEFLDKGVIADASNDEIDQLIDQLGGGDERLIEVLDDALATVAEERNYYVGEAGIEPGEATYKVK